MANIRAARSPGMSTTQVDPFQSGQVGGVGDQLSALMAAEDRDRRPRISSRGGGGGAGMRMPRQTTQVTRTPRARMGFLQPGLAQNTEKTFVKMIEGPGRVSGYQQVPAGTPGAVASGTVAMGQGLRHPNNAQMVSPQAEAAGEDIRRRSSGDDWQRFQGEVAQRQAVASDPYNQRGIMAEQEMAFMDPPDLNTAQRNNLSIGQRVGRAAAGKI